MATRSKKPSQESLERRASEARGFFERFTNKALADRLMLISKEARALAPHEKQALLQIAASRLNSAPDPDEVRIRQAKIQESLSNLAAEQEQARNDNTEGDDPT